MSHLSSIKERRKPQNLRIKIQKLSVLTAVALLGGAIVLTPITVQADTYEEQMNRLRQQNSSSAAANKELQTTEVSLETKIANLQATIATLEGQIRDNQNKSSELKQKIIETEAEIARQRQVLGVNVKQMYLDDEFTTIEKLASSRDLSHYVDKEQYRISVQNKIKQTLDRINELKQQQEGQKILVEKLLKDQQIMQADVAAEKAENNRLLALNQEQQAQYDQSIASNNTRISELQRQQAEENARLLRQQQEAARRIAADKAASRSNRPAPASAPVPSGVRAVSGHAYPWPNVPFPNSMVDPWGMYKRQCVSYTAWKVSASGRHMPYWGGRGNANQWDDNARAAGIPTDFNPRVGDVAVSNAGYYGHVMYVDAVHSDGTITISQYNAAWDGRYSEARIYPSGLVFIHF